MPIVNRSRGTTIAEHVEIATSFWRRGKGLIGRPTFKAPLPGLRDPRPSMWISYAPLDEPVPDHRLIFGQHHLLATPQQGWESLKVGRGAPPVWTRKGWLVLYHGVAGGEQPHRVRYCTGVLLLDRHDPRRVLYRSSHSVLETAAGAAAGRTGGHSGRIPGALALGGSRIV